MYIDIFGHGSHLQAILDCVSRVDFDSLHVYCKKTSKLAYYEGIKKLLLILVEQMYIQSDAGYVIPSRAFEIITHIWKSGTTDAFHTEVLSLLELSMTTKKETTEAERNAISVLLIVCCEPIVKYILKGNQCNLDKASLLKACRDSKTPLAQLLLDHMDSCVLTPNYIDLVQIGYELSSDEQRTLFLTNVFTYIIKTLTGVADAGVMSDEVLEEAFYDKLVELTASIEYEYPLLNAENVRDFVLISIMDNLTDAPALKFVNALVERFYKDYSKLEPIETYIRRILDHPDYQRLTQPEVAKLLQNQTPENATQRLAILTLLHSLNTIQPIILGKHHGLLDPLLTSYSATTDAGDKLILSILMSCESHGSATILPKMLMWGPGSDKTRQANAQAGTLLQTGVISIETFSLIDPSLMKYTFTHLPLDYALDSHTTQQARDHLIYDPGFFIPLFANLISSGAVDCRKFIECNGLGLVLMGMSASNDDVRSLCYQMMDQFYVMLQHARFKEQPSVMFILNEMKNSITDRSELDAPPRVPACIALCTGHALTILLHPENFMMTHITKWIFQGPTFDFNVK